MGIVNRTPDSFSDGGLFLNDGAARSHVDALVRAGADVLDLGAESTRPGAPPVSAAAQIARLGSLIAYAASLGVKVSVDTTSTEVAAFALAEGASMINSVALAPAREFAALAVRHGAELVLTHCRGSMTEMSDFSRYPDDGYRDVVEDVVREWRAAAAESLAVGLPRERLWFDPGLGFTKNAAQSLELCARLGELRAHVGHPILVGASRKSFVATAVAERELPRPEDRLGGSLAAALDCARRGANMLRVHDVRETVQALAYLRAVERHQRPRTVPSATTSVDAPRGEACSTA
jgi:dihydropteroate synthase